MLVCHCTVSIKVVLILAFPTTQIFCPWTFLRYFESIFNSSVTVALSVARYTVVVRVPAFSYRIPYRIFMKVLRSSISIWFTEWKSSHCGVGGHQRSGDSAPPWCQFWSKATKIPKEEVQSGYTQSSSEASPCVWRYIFSVFALCQTWVGFVI